MKINLNQKLRTLSGKEIKVITDQGNGKTTEENVFLFDVIINSVLGNYADEKDLRGVEKIKRYILSQKVYRKRNEAVDLTTDEVALIKELVGKNYPALVVGQVWQILEK